MGEGSRIWTYNWEGVSGSEAPWLYRSWEVGEDCGAPHLLRQLGKMEAHRLVRWLSGF